MKKRIAAAAIAVVTLVVIPVASANADRGGVCDDWYGAGVVCKAR